MEKVFDWSQPIISAASHMLQAILEYLPQLAGAIATLLIGWIIARLLRGVTVKIAGGIDRFADVLGLDKILTTGKANEDVVRIIGNAVFWIVILFFLTSATKLLGLSMFSGWLESLVAHLPNILSGGVIIFAGVVIGRLANDATQTAAHSLPSRTRALLGRSVQGFTLATMVVIGVDQIGIDITLLITAIAVAIGAIMGGLAIAFSLGSRTFVSNLIGARYLSRDYRVGEKIRIGDHEGVILEISSVAVVIDTGEGRMTLPAKLFSEQASLLIQKEAGNAR